MNTYFILSIWLLLIACSSSEKLRPKRKISFNLKNETAKCLKGNGLACSKVGFHYANNNKISESEYYYSKGCLLKEQSACFNLKEIKKDSSYKRRVNSRVKFYAKEISNCYEPTTTRRYIPSEIALEKKLITFKIKFKVNNEGHPYHIKVDMNKNISFEKCAKKIISKVRFEPPKERNPVEFYYEAAIMSKE